MDKWDVYVMDKWDIYVKHYISKLCVNVVEKSRAQKNYISLSRKFNFVTLDILKRSPIPWIFVSQSLKKQRWFYT